MTEAVNVFIPAAGRGERLQPVTFHIPKPLLPIAGRPVLGIVLEKVSRLPVKRIGVNLWYKGDVVRDWIGRSKFREKVISFPEEILLGTGGALKNAANVLSEEDFLVHNSDILSDIDLEELIRFHRSSRNIATLAVHDCPKFNNVTVDRDGLLTGVGNTRLRRPPNERLMAYTGIAVYAPEFLRFLPEGASSVVDAWLAAASSGRRVGSLDVSGCYWSDTGTPPAYAAAVIHEMRAEGETVYLDSSSHGCSEAVMDGYVVMEESSAVRKGASLRNCILLPGATVAENAQLQNCIVGPDFVIPLDEGEMLGSSEESVFLIGTGGSDRNYYRVKTEDGSLVRVKFRNGDDDFERHIAYTEFLRQCGVPVPGLLRVDKEQKEAEFEDLGDLSLYAWSKCGRPEHEVEAMYRKALDIAVALHTTASRRAADCPLMNERIFDYEHLRWETRYFIENFASRMRQIPGDGRAELDEELHRLAVKVDALRKVVIHRDFQSQNIMITKDGAPRVIDYQGARVGPPAYDVASLLWDPYHRIGEDTREELIGYYVSRIEEEDGGGFDRMGFRASLLPCRLQRHMQALGAYGFLSAVKGKKFFLKHAKEGLRLLREDISELQSDFPALHDLIMRL
jgi:NDP-sugar pyrophosphorylase family protein